MATKNDITGDSIASRVATESYRDGWDRVYTKKSAEQWLKDPSFDYVSAIINPNGWHIDNLDLDTPLSLVDFSQRLSNSTILVKQKNDSH